MMTSKQKWFVNKLLKEIETEFKEDLGLQTNFGSNGYDAYRTTIKEASDDISFLLKAKENLENGREWHFENI